VYCIEEMYKFDALPAVGQTIRLSPSSISEQINRGATRSGSFAVQTSDACTTMPLRWRERKYIRGSS
jgi:hypothetical protein